MRTFFEGSMRCAAVILFIVALVTVVSGALPLLSLLKSMVRQLSDPPYGTDWMQILNSLLGGFGRAVLPFFGAALFWRLDKLWGHRPEGVK